MGDLVTVYVLRCESDKYYVGRTTRNVWRRCQLHAKGRGSEWTRLFCPVQVIEITERADPADETSTTLKYMEMYGICNVRGGRWPEVILAKSTTHEITRLLEANEAHRIPVPAAPRLPRVDEVRLVPYVAGARHGRGNVPVYDVRPHPSESDNVAMHARHGRRNGPVYDVRPHPSGDVNVVKHDSGSGSGSIFSSGFLMKAVIAGLVTCVTGAFLPTRSATMLALGAGAAVLGMMDGDGNSQRSNAKRPRSNTGCNLCGSWSHLDGGCPRQRRRY
ncbi:CCHC-type domain-containing protein [Plasmodiophora brassicae]